MTRQPFSVLCLAWALAVPAYAGGLTGEPLTPAQAVLTKASVNQGTATGQNRLQHYPQQNGRSNQNWGSVLTDIARHLPAGGTYQDAYLRYTRAGDLVTAGHEWTHFLNAYLSSKSAGNASSFYLLADRFITLSTPERLRGIVPYVPPSLRAELHDLYLVQNAGNARVDPLYLFDEWTAYINDVTIAVDQLEGGKPLNPFYPDAIQTRTAGNVLEFMLYGFAVGMAVKQHDPAYYASAEGHALREFIALNARRSIEIHGKALRWDELSRGDARHTMLMRNLRNSADTAEMRAWVKSDLGMDWADALGVATASLPPASGGRVRLQ